MEPPQRYEGLTEVTKMAAPIVFGQLSYVLMQFADQVMVARLGTAALAATGPAGLWFFIFSTFFLGIAGCVSTFASQSLGRGQKEQGASYAWQGIYIGMVGGVLGMAIWPFADDLFGLMGHTPEVTRLGVQYFRIRMFGYVFLCWQAALTSFFQAVNRPRVPMVAAWVANILNIGLNYVLIFGKFGFPRLEVAGAAWATVIAMAIQVAILHAVFLSKPLTREFETRSRYAFDWLKARELVRIGWPAGLSLFLDVFNWGVFTSFLVGRCGDLQMAAHNVAINFLHVAFMPAVGLNHAIAPIVGQWIGRKNIATAKQRTYTTLKLAIGFMTMAGLCFAIFAKPLTRIFFSTDPQVVELAAVLLILAALFQAFDAVNIVVLGALRGAGDTRWVMWAMLIGAYVFFLPVATFLSMDEIALSRIPGVPAAWVLPGLGLEAKGAWIGATVYIIALSGVLLWRFHGERWRDIRIFEHDRIAETKEPPLAGSPMT